MLPFVYDADGNLLGYGRFSVVWDAENRPLSFTPQAGPFATRKSVSLAYDDNGRRIQKIVNEGSTSVYISQSTNRFVYDGWNLVNILDGTNGILYSFTWGSDLSGTMQRAGGVGGLISM